MKIRTEKENIRLKGGLRTIAKKEKNEIYLVMDNIKSMFNVGAMFRTAEAVQVKKIYLCGITATPPRNKIFKTSMGMVEHVAWEYFEKIEDAIADLKQQGVQIVALEQTDQSVDYCKAKFKFPLAVIVGHEKRGVSKKILKDVDLAVEMPMLGRANSLNVATSAGIILYKILEKTKRP